MLETDIQRIWPEWQIVKPRIGKGSFGEVYKAVRTEEGITSYAAIKVLSIPQETGDETLIGFDENKTRSYYERVKNNCVREIELMVSLRSHANIVRIEDYKVVPRSNGEIGWNIFIRMELLTTLQQNHPLMDGQSAMEADIVKLGRDMCEALRECESRHILHRDIKPENIFVNEYGYYKLGDFGIARNMENDATVGSLKGTPNYMAPEVYHGRAYDNRADIYSLGIVMYKMLNKNRLPFITSADMSLDPEERVRALDRRRNGEPLPPPCDASPEMAGLILKACAFNPDERFRNASEMANALMRMGSGAAAIPVPGPTKPIKKKKAPNKDKKPLPKAAIGAAAAAVLAIAAGVLIWGMQTKSVSVSSVPQKTEYFLGETLAQDGLTLSAVNNFGSEKQITEGFKIENPVMSAAGTHEVQGSYKGKTFSFPVQVVRAEIVGIKVQTEPEKTEYFVGEKVDASGLSITVQYSDGSEETLKTGFTCEEKTLEKAGKSDVEVTYSDMTASFAVTAKKDTVTGVTLKTAPGKTEYYEGDELSLEGLVLEASYLSGRTESVKEGFSSSVKTLSKTGSQKITVSYEGKSTTFQVTVKENALLKIGVRNHPTKREYQIGETLDASGLTLTAAYSNGATEEITSGFTCEKMTFKEAGSQRVSVTYDGKKTSFSVTVLDERVSSIAIATTPTRRWYYVSNALETAGMTLKITYVSGKTEIIDSDFTVSPSVLTQVGQQTVTVTYGGASAAFNVTVYASPVNLLWLTTNPTKMTYTVGERLNTAGLSLTAKHLDGTTSVIQQGFTCSPETFTTAGTQTVTVTYGGKSVSFNVTVKAGTTAPAAVTVTDIMVKTKPKKTTYTAGEKLSSNGLTLTATYSDGTKKTITSGFTCSPVVLSEAGTQMITVMYQGQKTLFYVTVKEAKTVTKLTVKTYPTKTIYRRSETLDTSGMEVTVTYSDGTTELITSGFTCSPMKLSNLYGQEKITVSYGGKTTTFSILIVG